MNTYKITATTASGKTLANTIVEVNESKARKAFREIYRHGEDCVVLLSGTLSSNTGVASDMTRPAISSGSSVAVGISGSSVAGASLS